MDCSGFFSISKWRSKIAPQTPGWFAGNPPQPKSTGWGLVSQGDTQLDPFTLKKLAGHTDLNTTMRYVHLNDEDVRAAMDNA
jgi:integrase